MKKKIDVILVMAGNGVRSELPYNKALHPIHQIPLFIYTLRTISKLSNIHQIYLVVNEKEEKLVDDITKQNGFDVVLVKGGNTRRKSVQCALQKLDQKHDVLIHDVARPLVSVTDIENLIEQTNTVGTLYHKITDTLKEETESQIKTINRDTIKAITTPQYFSQTYLVQLLENERDITDELQLFEQEVPITFIEETTPNMKVTTKRDLMVLETLLCPTKMWIGHSFDFHPFEIGRKLILGGELLPSDKGLAGHSDADALYHAVAESIIGALGLGDIGTLFPDTDETYHNMNSAYFIQEIMKEVTKRNLKVHNIDAIIYLEKPNLKNYKYKMATNIQRLTQCDFVNVKATTMEKKGLVGTGEGIGCEVVCLITNL